MEISKGAVDIGDERMRQMCGEGFDAPHDDKQVSQELAWGAVCYAAPERVYEKCGPETGILFIDPWPWENMWDKREKHDRRRRLVIAGALIAAEIDRLDRRHGEKGEQDE